MVDIDAARQIGKTIPAAARPDFPPAAAPSKPVRTLGVRHTPRSSQRPSRRCTRTRAGRLARSAARIHRPARYDVGPRAGCDRWARSGAVTGGRVTGVTSANGAEEERALIGRRDLEVVPARLGNVE